MSEAQPRRNYNSISGKLEAFRTAERHSRLSDKALVSLSPYLLLGVLTV